MAIDVARLKQLREEFGDIPLPESDFSQFDMANGQQAAQIIDVGIRLTSVKRLEQLYIKWKIVSQSRDKGHTPYMTFQLPVEEELRAAKEAKDQEAIDNQLMGFTIFNSTYVLLTDLPRFADLGAVLLALENGDLKRILIGKKAELVASHVGVDEKAGFKGFLRLKVRRAIGLPPSEVSRPMPDPKPTRRRTAPTTRKPPARRRK